jgi:hypothetical protein
MIGNKIINYFYQFNDKLFLPVFIILEKVCIELLKLPKFTSNSVIKHYVMKKKNHNNLA